MKQVMVCVSIAGLLGIGSIWGVRAHGLPTSVLSDGQMRSIQGGMSPYTCGTNATCPNAGTCLNNVFYYNNGYADCSVALDSCDRALNLDGSQALVNCTARQYLGPGCTNPEGDPFVVSQQPFCIPPPP